MRYTPAIIRLQFFSRLAIVAETAPVTASPDRRTGRPGAPLPALAATPVAAVAVALALAAATPAPASAASPPPLRAERAAVASDHPLASAAGVELLRRGGNAADAACATALALGVLNPQTSGIGGGGFALVHMVRDKKVVALDFRERAPAALKPEVFVRDGKIDPQLSRRGGLAVGVPGEVRGLAELVRRWGKLPFSACVRPAERLARVGVALSERVSEATSEGSSRDPQSATYLSQVFTLGRPFALPLRAGETVRRPALADTLARLRTGGADAFYRGPIADEIVKVVKASGGVLTAEDLQAYKAVERAPLATTYRGQQIFTMPPPSSGGIVISEVLGILAERVKEPPRGPARFSSPYLHVLAEALKHGFADRARHLGDPDFAAIPTDKLLDPAYHKELAGRIKDDAVLAPERYGLPLPPGSASANPPRDGGTAHLSVMDADGNTVALTTTVNLWFGAKLIAGKTGIVLNNQIDDFSLAPDVPNAFGLLGRDKNFVAPGKRPLSSMAPTIVLDGGDRAKIAVGGAGGPRIITGTLQVLLNVLDGKMDAQEASVSPRIHHQWSPDVLGFEPEFADDVVKALEKKGHKTRRADHVATVNILVRTDKGIEAAAEYRAGGAPAGY